MAMFTRSPALHATRPPGLIDPHHPAEYPVLLGEAFKHSDGPRSFSLRYNWKAQKHSTISRMHVAKTNSESGNSYELTIEDRLHKDQPYRYAGQPSERLSARKNEEEADNLDQSLALMWDPAKSAFTLEPISASLDFNLTCAPDQTQREIDAHRKLQRTTSNDPEANMEALNGPTLQSSDSDSDPDASNPYDFRHFLAEARKNVANGANNARSRTTIAGSSTPVPGSLTPTTGSLTPLPGLSSPALVAKSSTPRFHPTSGPSTKKRKLDRSPNSTRKPTARKPATSAQPLSSERIIESESDSEVEVPVVNHRNTLSNLNSGPSDTSPIRRSSPHLIVSDASASLEIDLGSPPSVEKFTQRKRHVNPDAFRRLKTSRRSPPSPVAGDADGDVEMTDADVEELELGSPKAGRGMSFSSSTHAGRIEKADADDEDDDGLAAELEAALEEEEDEEEESITGQGVGLGITNEMKEDESEVSEEE